MLAARELAEDAFRSGDDRRAQEILVEAGDRATRDQRWRLAIQSYRSALELDLIDRMPISRCIAALREAQYKTGTWTEYLTAIDAHPSWPHFTCRSAQLVVGNETALVTCPLVGPVLEMMMPDHGVIEVQPTASFVGITIEMVLIIMRRAIWAGSPTKGEIRSARIAFSGRIACLFAAGHWSYLS